MSTLPQFPVLLNVDVVEYDSKCTITADVAGFQAQDVSVTKWQDSLVIELKSCGNAEQQNFYLGELEAETYRRVIPLGFAIHDSDIKTALSSGKLTIDVEKESTTQKWEQSQPATAVA